MNPETQALLDNPPPDPVDNLTAIAGILDALERQGCRFALDPNDPAISLKRDAEGRVGFHGNATPELRAAIQARRHEVLAAYENQERQKRCRWLQAPDEALPLQLHRRLPKKGPQRDALVDYVANQQFLTVTRQDKRLVDWFQTRVAVYAPQANSNDEAELRAALDLVCWQRECEWQDALQFCEGLAESAQWGRGAKVERREPEAKA